MLSGGGMNFTARDEITGTKVDLRVLLSGNLSPSRKPRTCGAVSNNHFGNVEAI